MDEAGPFCPGLTFTENVGRSFISQVFNSPNSTPPITVGNVLEDWSKMENDLKSTMHKKNHRLKLNSMSQIDKVYPSCPAPPHREPDEPGILHI